MLKKYIKSILKYFNIGNDGLNELNEASYNKFNTACKEGDIELVKYYLNKGIDVDANDGEALVSALSVSDYNMVETLINAGADVNIADSKVLLLASYWNNVDIVKLLKERGAKY